MAKIAYGPRVVGELAAKRQAKVTKKIRYGPKVSEEMQPESVVDDQPEEPEQKKTTKPLTSAQKKAAAKKRAAEKKAAKAVAAAEKKAAAAEPEAAAEEEAVTDPENVMTEEAFEALMQNHVGDDGFVSIDDLKAALTSAPSSFNRLMAWELNRPEGPRVGAVAHLLEHEQKRDDGPRATVLGALESALKSARGKTKE